MSTAAVDDPTGPPCSAPGADAGGHCRLEGGPAISVAAARRIGCDATVVAVIERDGVPLDVGRARRQASGRPRRLLQLREQGCRLRRVRPLPADAESPSTSITPS